ncbi:hypothetical protein CRG98_042417 [Punica granatum]|uniref:Leucine-rich repeat-containing N-terminal plant-type domain-containing protein n=1 Tax=Punica granatum TaxID=22663 RepID=A0A2I0I133_PUNGR|nr:hypothetical protein CRG98_042417 [Punica granatum]
MASWQKGTDCCSWEGVTCHMSKDYMIGLDLSCSWLQGALHSNSTLFSFRNFQRLNLAMGNLTSLEYLDLFETEFTGSIPPTLGNLDRLFALYLGGINLNGTVDFDMFARLKNLESFYLWWNLNVMLPNNGNCSFPRLKGLSLLGVNLTKFPYFLRSSPELEVLVLSGNKISGPIPEWVGRVLSSTLTCLLLSSNNFTGEIPSSMCQLSSLRDLYLLDDRLNGTIPRCLGNLSNLSANCTSLEALHISDNGIHDTFPHWLLNATPALESLDLRSNMFHGVINEITLPPQLESLYLSNNQFSGQLPIVFFRNSNIELVDLANNNFDGPLPIPPPNVWFYSVANNKFSGDIPHQLCNATLLEVVNLSNNSLTGSIPHCFIKLSASVLVFRANKLVGKIPEIFLSGNNLRTIRLSQNRLEGTLSRSLANCKNLEVLDLSENELEGSFPYWLDTLSNLQVLDLRSNKLHGLINSSKKNNHLFPKLNIFDLFDNNVHGHLPVKYIANFIAMKDESRSNLQYIG